MDKDEFGCGLVVNKRIHHLVSCFITVHERIATIRIRVKFYKIGLNCVYAATKEKDDVVKDAIYALGPKSSSETFCEGRASNGVKLIDFDAAPNMVVGCIKFQRLDQDHLDVPRSMIIQPD